MAINLKPEYYRYRRYFVDLQSLYKKREIVVYTSLTLSLLAVAFFGLFALKPTLTTIASLFKELEEKKKIDQTLQTKIDNLNRAQNNYALVATSIPLVNQALPQNHTVAEVAYQIEGLAQKFNLSLRATTFEPVTLQGKAPGKKVSLGPEEINFNLTTSGSFEDLKAFLNSLENSRRILTLKSFNLNRAQLEEEQIMSLSASAKTYYLPKEKK